MAETEQKTVLSIDTSRSVNSVKELKERIKELKDEIVAMESAGEDASGKYEELGTSIRQMKDITEQATLSSSDLGDRLAVVTGSFKGVAGAISTATGVMGMMGVESEKTTKLLTTMASAMSITTGIQAMESGYKSISKLVGGFAKAAKGAKTLGGAIKAAFASNPIGLLIVALTSAIALFGKLKDKAEETAENIKASAKASAEAFMSEAQSVLNGASKSYGKFIAKGKSQSVDYFKDMLEQYAIMSNLVDGYAKKNTEKVEEFIRETAEGLNTSKLIQDATHTLESQSETYGAMIELAKDQGKEYSEEMVGQMKKVTDATQDLLDRQIAAKRLEQHLWQEAVDNMDKSAAEYATVTENLRRSKEEFNALIEQSNKAQDEYEAFRKEAEQKRKEEADKAKQAAKDALKAAQDNAKKRLDNDKKTAEEELRLRQATTKRFYDLDVEELVKKSRSGQMTEAEYNAAMLALDEKYYSDSQEQFEDYIEKMEEIKEKYKNNKYLTKEDKESIFTDVDLEGYKQQIDDLRRESDNARYEYGQNQISLGLDKTELENLIETQNIINQIEQDSFDKRLAIQQEYTDKSKLMSTNKVEMEMKLLSEQRDYENQLFEAFTNENANKMAMLNERYANGLLSEQDFAEQMNALSQEYVEREREHSNTLVEIKRNEIEQKKALDELSYKWQQSMMGSISGIFSSMADILGENNEAYKGLKIAATLIDTMQGSIAAYTGMIQTIPGVPGIVAGAAAAASVVAQGIATIAQMNKVDAKNGTTGTSSIAMKTFTTPQTATIATGYSDDYSEGMGKSFGKSMQDQRVYVVLNDINEAQSRKVQVEMNNTY